MKGKERYYDCNINDNNNDDDNESNESSEKSESTVMSNESMIVMRL